MVTVIRFSDKPGFLCGSSGDAVEVRFKDRSFAGVVCKEHLFELMQKQFATGKKAGSDETVGRA